MLMAGWSCWIAAIVYRVLSKHINPPADGSPVGGSKPGILNRRLIEEVIA